MTHDYLISIALRWLKRPESGKGPGCQLALAEVGGLFGGERCDAYGYRWGYGSGSVVVEAKVSRSDFLADAKKPHRNGEVLGMGDFRYYICPEGLINIQDLPNGWGLIWVTKRGHVKLMAGHVCVMLSCGFSASRELVNLWRHESNREMELGMMAHLLERFGDPESINVRHKELHAWNMKLRERLAEATRYRSREMGLQMKIERYKQLYGDIDKNVAIARGAA